MSIEAGQQLLHYRLIEKIGEGGMGVVWKATDTTLDREVAIKILPETFAADADRLARFEHEAKVLASLNHPNIAAVYSVHQAEGLRFLAMELVRGEDLAVRLARGPLPLVEALGIALQVAEALEAAHESGVIHRDLKPANIQLTESGQAKVLDFGLAKTAEVRASDRTSLEHSPTVTSLGTVAGVILGTAAYMSPEQARGKVVDRRADIWSFGCVLYEMLTGAGPFRGETVTDTLGAIMHRDPDWEALPAGTPPGLLRLLRRCMRRDERQRLRDIGDARILIEEALGGDSEETAAAPAAAPRSRFALLAVTALLAAGLGIAATWLALRQAAPAPSSLRKFSFALPAGEAGRPGSPNISPDGTHLVFTGGGRLWLRALSEVDARPIPGTDGARRPFWSADSKWVGFARDRNIEKVAVAGGEPSLIAVTPAELQVDRGNATWSADGKIVFATSTSGLHLVPDQGGDVTTFLDTAEGDTDFHQVSVRR